MKRNTLALLTLASLAWLPLGCGSQEDAPPTADSAEALPGGGAAEAAPEPAAAAEPAVGDDDTMHRGHRLEIEDVYVIAGTESGRPATPEECRDGCKAHATCVSWKWTESILGPGNPGICTWWATVGKPVPTGNEKDVAGVIASKAR